jgi:hypothetical protein
MPSTAVIFFFVGFAAGWIVGRFQARGAASPSDVSFVRSKTIRTMDLKCQCGATFRFRETSGRADPGSQPFPTGDSFTCPKCGKTIDLTEERRLESELAGRPLG